MALGAVIRGHKEVQSAPLCFDDTFSFKVYIIYKSPCSNHHYRDTVQLLMQLCISITQQGKHL